MWPVSLDTHVNMFYHIWGHSSQCLNAYLLNLFENNAQNSNFAQKQSVWNYILQKEKERNKYETKLLRYMSKHFLIY